ncbi:MAG: class I SAM-dependent RNA methyltransferase [Gemmatimonadota bacterium]
MPELVQITNIAAGGAGVGRLRDGRAVFVHRTAVGDMARISLIEKRKAWARGALEAVETPGPGRRVAPCRYYAKCGGCTLEHLEYEAQLAAKAQIVHDALTRIGKLEVEAPVVIASPNEFRYRNRVSFTLLRLARRIVAGFHELEQPGRVLDIDAACLLPEATVAEAWQELRAGWGERALLLPAGARLRLTLRASADGAVSLVIEGGNTPGRPELLLEAVPGIQSVWHRPRPDAPLVLLGGREAIPESWQDEDLDLSGAVFLQVNRASAQLLEEHVMTLAGDVAGKGIVDAYCGVGLHARRLARLGARVIGIELDPLAVAEADAADVEGTKFVCGRVEEELPHYLPADIAILNPPRAGVHEGVAQVLTRKAARQLIYISCNPATLARDLDRLRARYTVKSIRCFDLFPQTAHVETVVELACVTT